MPGTTEARTQARSIVLVGVALLALLVVGGVAWAAFGDDGPDRPAATSLPPESEQPWAIVSVLRTEYEWESPPGDLYLVRLGAPLESGIRLDEDSGLGVLGEGPVDGSGPARALDDDLVTLPDGRLLIGIERPSRDFEYISALGAVVVDVDARKAHRVFRDAGEQMMGGQALIWDPAALTLRVADHESRCYRWDPERAGSGFTEGRCPVVESRPLSDDVFEPHSTCCSTIRFEIAGEVQDAMQADERLLRHDSSDGTTEELLRGGTIDWRILPEPDGRLLVVQSLPRRPDIFMKDVREEGTEFSAALWVGRAAGGPLEKVMTWQDQEVALGGPPRRSPNGPWNPALETLHFFTNSTRAPRGRDTTLWVLGRSGSPTKILTGAELWHTEMATVPGVVFVLGEPEGCTRSGSPANPTCFPDHLFAGVDGAVHDLGPVWQPLGYLDQSRLFTFTRRLDIDGALYASDVVRVDLDDPTQVEVVYGASESVDPDGPPAVRVENVLGDDGFLDTWNQ